MTASPVPGGGTDLPASGSARADEAPPRHRRRPDRPAPPLHRRRGVVVAGMGALTLVGAVLAVTGVHQVRTSTLGRYEESVDPDDPGYQAYVEPTPTMAVLHRGEGDRLVGVAVLALASDDEGGSVIVVPPATLVPGEGDETTIAALYRAEGAEAAARAVGLAVTAAVGEHVEVDDARWADLVAPVGGVEMTLDEPLGPWEAGAVTLEPAEVGPFLAARGDDETDLDRAERQQAFWNAWLPLVDEGGDDALPGEVESGIGRFVRGVAHTGGSAATLPVGRDDGDGDEVRLRPDERLVGEFVAGAVPYPRSPEPGARVRVRLLDGTGDGSLTPSAARRLVEAGAEIVIVGNASSFDEPTTRLVPVGEDGEALARRLRDDLGGGDVDDAATGQDGQITPDDEVDVTVILGDDAGDLIER